MILFQHKFLTHQAALTFLKYFLMDNEIVSEEPINGFPDNRCYHTADGRLIYFATNEFNDNWVYEVCPG